MKFPKIYTESVEKLILPNQLSGYCQKQTTGKRWKIVYKNGIEKRIHPDQINDFLENNWYLGRIKGIFIRKDGKEKRVSPDQLEEFLNDDWELGRLPHSEKQKQKQRISQIRNMENNYEGWSPGYNKKGCEFFKQFDEENNTQGRFAVYGGGEFKIKELGYFPDYINFDLKLIMEWDEESHFDTNGNLREKDIQRQKKIQDFYPDFEFRRIREREVA